MLLCCCLHVRVHAAHPLPPELSARFACLHAQHAAMQHATQPHTHTASPTSHSCVEDVGEGAAVARGRMRQTGGDGGASVR